MLFEDEKLYLRKVRSDDVDMYHKWRNDIDVMKTTSPFLNVYTYDETKDFFDNVILSSSGSEGYIIMDKAENIEVGIVSLTNIDYKNRNCEIIIDLGNKEFWGKGYGRIATELLLDFAFKEMNMHRVFLNVFSFNERAIGLYKKIGFREEGRSRESIFRNGEYHDVVQMGLLESEFKK
ncbi:GNAT family N-acetyltransferase [Facklamia languida]|uniref:N-acetyltransferase domain-containing protein n=1 Tax=Facklamia languida CCUG 37842 TaxID=883113 RepID=H3NHH3_9LACT|nr:GNAT family protein [Facklamia languida]EHR38228.1 hypothetical protein HMPREF9708_00312 [Facklamia languida CCUG 37842]